MPLAAPLTAPSCPIAPKMAGTSIRCSQARRASRGQGSIDAAGEVYQAPRGLGFRANEAREAIDRTTHHQRRLVGEAAKRCAPEPVVWASCLGPPRGFDTAGFPCVVATLLRASSVHGRIKSCQLRILLTGSVTPSCSRKTHRMPGAPCCPANGSLVPHRTKNGWNIDSLLASASC